jgi:signal transduction histidine kinase
MMDTSFTGLIDRWEPFMENIRNLNEGKSWVKLEHDITGVGGRKLFFENTTAILRSPEDGRVFYQTYLRNVTEHIAMEFRLRRDMENLDTIVSSVGAGLAIFGRDMKLERNNQKYREFSKQAGVSLDNQRCFLCPRNNAGDCAVRKSFSNGMVVREERAFSLPGGETAHFLVSATPVKEADGSISKIIEMLVDVTETKSIEMQLLQSEKLASIGELASGIAHELNNPMAGIIGYSEFLLDAPGIPEESRKDVERIHKEAVRCSKIIQNLLTFARRHKPQKGEISVNDVIEVTTDMIEYEFRVNNVALKKDYEKNLKYVVGDSYQLQQVFLNIVNNAFYFLKDKPGARYIALATRNTENGVRVTIKNNGPRISAESIGKIFDPFFTTKDVGKGTGLGLSVSHGIIKSHQGHIGVANVEDGVVFTVDLPSAPREA